MNPIELLFVIIGLLIAILISYVAGHRQGSIRGRFQAYREMDNADWDGMCEDEEDLPL